ncbi:sugar transferase [Limosilactobacillus fermentum]
MNQVYRTTIKRILDTFFGVLLLICLLPLMLVLAIWIKLDSKGPVLFKQERVGRNGKRFTIYKFRSMSDDAPHQMATSEFDTALSYITWSGRLMRKTSLDELPQTDTQKADYDGEYASNVTLRGDFSILMETVLAVLARRGVHDGK